MPTLRSDVDLAEVNDLAAYQFAAPTFDTRRRDAVKDLAIPKRAPLISTEDPALFYCACDGGTRPKSIDPCDISYYPYNTKSHLYN